MCTALGMSEQLINYIFRLIFYPKHKHSCYFQILGSKIYHFCTFPYFDYSFRINSCCMDCVEQGFILQRFMYLLRWLSSSVVSSLISNVEDISTSALWCCESTLILFSINLPIYDVKSKASVSPPLVLQMHCHVIDPCVFCFIYVPFMNSQLCLLHRLQQLQLFPLEWKLWTQLWDMWSAMVGLSLTFYLSHFHVRLLFFHVLHLSDINGWHNQ
jgi:hypothetical protein